MIFKMAGNILKKNTKTRIWWLKLLMAIFFSNLIFFILFSGDEKIKTQPSSIPEGWVEIQLQAELLTTFQSGKKVLLLHREGRKKVEAMLETSPHEPEGRFTVLVKETEAEVLLKHQNWEIVPFLKMLTFAPLNKGTEHEIRY